MLSSIVFVSVWNCGLIEGWVKLIKILATTFIVCPIAIAYSMGQIIKSVSVCESVCVSVCENSHSRIS